MVDKSMGVYIYIYILSIVTYMDLGDMHYINIINGGLYMGHNGILCIPMGSELGSQWDFTDKNSEFS